MTDTKITTTQKHREDELSELLPRLTPTQFTVIMMEMAYFIYARKHGINDPAAVEKMQELILSGNYIEAAEFISGLIQDAEEKGAAE